VIKVILAALVGLTLSAGITHFLTLDENEKRIPVKNRWGAYTVCALAVFAFSVCWGIAASHPIFPGDEHEINDGRQVVIATEYVPGLSLTARDKYIERTFYVLIIPSLIGVRLALGRKPKA